MNRRQTAALTYLLIRWERERLDYHRVSRAFREQGLIEDGHAARGRSHQLDDCITRLHNVMRDIERPTLRERVSNLQGLAYGLAFVACVVIAVTVTR